MSSSPYIVELKTGGGINIKNTINSVCGILKEANLIFDKDGLKIKAMDSTQVCFVHVSIESDKLDKYAFNSTNREFKAGVNTLTLSKYLTAIKRNDNLTLRIKRDDPGHLCIKIESIAKKQTWYYELDLMHIEQDEDVELDDHEYDCEIELDSDDFQETCKTLSVIDDKLTIQSRDSKITFSVDGGPAGTGRGKLVKYSDDPEDEDEEDEDPKSKKKDKKMRLKVGGEGGDEIIKETFLMSFLLLFAKSASLDDKVYIYFANDKALILKYAIAEIGCIKYALAPMIKEMIRD